MIFRMQLRYAIGNANREQCCYSYSSISPQTSKQYCAHTGFESHFSTDHHSHWNHPPTSCAHGLSLNSILLLFEGMEIARASPLCVRSLGRNKRTPEEGFWGSSSVAFYIHIYAYIWRGITERQAHPVRMDGGGRQKLDKYTLAL